MNLRYVSCFIKLLLYCIVLVTHYYRACSLLAGLFWRNPQFGVTISPPPTDDKDHVTHVVISLMQESQRLDENFGIGTTLFKVTPVQSQSVPTSVKIIVI